MVADKLTVTQTPRLWGCLGNKLLCGKLNKSVTSPGHSIFEGAKP